MKSIVWLASYPKSGNTWFRIFLANLLSGSETPADLDQIETTNFASRPQFDWAIGWESSDFTDREILSWRLGVQEKIAHEQSRIFFKAHEAFVDPLDGAPLFSLAATRCALCFIRNPLDIAVSFSHHRGKSIDSTIRFMNDPHALLNEQGGSLSRQLLQPLGDWSSHVLSWADAPGLPVLFLRYEDMLERTEETFTAACRFAGLPDNPSTVRRALAQSRFEILQAQESRNGFAEAEANRVFFRRGRSGTWRGALSDGQVAGIVERHATVMRRFGYLDGDGAPVS